MSTFAQKPSTSRTDFSCSYIFVRVQRASPIIAGLKFALGVLPHVTAEKVGE